MEKAGNDNLVKLWWWCESEERRREDMGGGWGGEKDRQTDRQTDRQRQRQKFRHLILYFFSNFRKVCNEIQLVIISADKR